MKVVIVGGVAAGMSTAARLRRLDEQAEIVVLERGDHVSFANCGLPYHLGGVIEDRESLLLQTAESLRASLNLEVRTGHEVAAINRQEKTVAVRELATGNEYRESYDKLVLCPGAKPIRPPIPGSDLSRVFVLRDLADMDAIQAAIAGGAKRAIIIGAGYVGCELAENLHHRGLEVEVVELLDQIMAPLDPEMARPLEQHLRWHGVKVHTGAAAEAIREEGEALTVVLGGGATLAADFVVFSVGVKPDARLAEQAGLALGAHGGVQVDDHLRTSDPDLYAAGDVIETTHAVTGEVKLLPLAGPANRQGRTVADNLAGRETTWAPVQGTAIVKVFEMVAGGTGAIEKVLKAAGRDYAKAYVHQGGHAGYYPGTAQMQLKILFAPHDGRLLGAEAVGFDGVDKRLDVLATALRAGLTVFDLEHLELAYAPPFSSAKDPVNMAGFVAANMLRGDLECWYAEDYDTIRTQGVLVDVRSPEEFETWHIPEAINVPLSELRSSLDKLPTGKPLYVYCRVGFRSYLAYRLLKQRGFEHVQSLAGGTLTFCAYHGTGLCTGEPEPVCTSYAEAPPVSQPAATTGATLTLDCTGLQCPGPIRKLSDAAAQAAVGDEILVSATDPGFAADVPAWCAKRGHQLVNLTQDAGRVEARVRIGQTTAPAAPVAVAPAVDKKTMVIFSGDLDKVLAGFVIANGAAAMGSEVTMFFTFWGLNALRKPASPPVKKPLLDAMFGKMMPRGVGKLKLSNMHLAGMGTAMMKHVMKQKNVDSLPEMVAMAQAAGVKLVACSMSMGVMGLTREELLDDIEVAGVASFLGESDEAGMTLFI